VIYAQYGNKTMFVWLFCLFQCFSFWLSIRFLEQFSLCKQMKIYNWNSVHLPVFLKSIFYRSLNITSTPCDSYRNAFHTSFHLHTNHLKCTPCSKISECMNFHTASHLSPNQYVNILAMSHSSKQFIKAPLAIAKAPLSNSNVHLFVCLSLCLSVNLSLKRDSPC